MSTFIVPRYNAPSLEFDGVLLADVSSQEDGNPRWQEIRLYRTASGKYVAESVGHSTLPGEHALRHVHVVEHPAGLRDSLLRTQKGRSYLSDLAIQALEEAHATDPAIVVLGTERI